MWGRDKEIGEIKSHRWKYFKSEIKLNNDGATTLVRLQSHRWTRESHDLQICELLFVIFTDTIYMVFLATSI